MKKISRLLWSHYANLLIAVILHSAAYIVLYKKRIIQTDQEYSMAVILVVSMIVFFLWFNWILSWLPGRWLRFSLNIFCLAILAILVFYQGLRGAPLDFALIYTNFGELFSRDGMSQVWAVGGPLIIGAIALALCWIFYQEYKYHSFSHVYRRKRHWLVWGTFFFLANLFLFWWQPKNPNQLYAFARSGIMYFQNPDESLMPHTDSPVRYPFVHESQSSKRFKEKPKFVFLILIESFSSVYVDKKTESGREITPFINRLAKETLFFDEFYANSMQTERGHSATICSLIPSYRTKIMSSYIKNNFRCLPEILSEQGYTTTFIQGHPRLTFDNTGNFMRRIGFHHVLSMDETFVKPDEQPYVWGWGLQDDKFYQKTFGYLDKLREVDPQAKLFTMMATISNHQGFDEMPDEQKYIFPFPKSFKENFINSMNLADKYLETFFQELDRRGWRDDSLVIIMGDHGFPTGMRQNVSNEMGFYNELFRVPLIVMWGNKIRPARIKNFAFSQIDVAPSIVDWLGINTSTPFVGKSLPLSQAEAERVADLVPILQPYDGVYLGTVFHPWKYMKSLSTGEEYLFHLGDDPMESHNLIDNPKLQEKVSRLKQGLKRIYLNQRLLREDRLYPPSVASETRYIPHR